jgi:hypothetical protein
LFLRRAEGLAPKRRRPRRLRRGTVDFRVIGGNWDETLRLAASIKAGTVAPSEMRQIG